MGQKDDPFRIGLRFQQVSDLVTRNRDVIFFRFERVIAVFGRHTDQTVEELLGGERGKNYVNGGFF